MGYVRQEIHGTTPQDIMKINENTMSIWDKVHGDINYSDVDKKVQKQLMTQWIPVQGDGNLDSKYPLYIRFFVPPNVSNINSAMFNFISENYRMDSSITSSAESKQEVVNIVSSASPSSNQTSSSAPSQTPTSSTVPQQSPTSSSQTVGVSSVSNATVGVSSVGGGGVTSYGGGGDTAYVRKWGSPGYEVSAPTDYIYPNNMDMVTANLGGFITSNDNRLTYGALCPDGKMKNSSVYIEYVDLYSIQHSHSIPSHTHGIPAHSHSISLQGHSHSISLQAHDHTINIPSHNHTITIPPHNHTVDIPSHTHTVNGSVTIPSHNHTLNEGIKVSTTNPSNVNFHINDVSVAVLQGSDSRNNIDIADKIKIGDWNVIKVTTSNLARISCYGTISVVIKNT